jgi:hypothetical protein
VAAFGCELPLLPKTLDVQELLSVQAHPPGNAEAYLVLDADVDATLHLGFVDDIDPAELGLRLHAARGAQRRLAGRLNADATPLDLQSALAPALARRADSAELRAAVRGLTSADVEAELTVLRDTYWHMLERLNPVLVARGQMIFNATPARLRAGRLASAEVHALGNPERRRALLLEIRRPGPTLRAWDHVRFPMREVSIDEALASMNLRATHPDEFFVEREETGEPGVTRTISCHAFEVHHLSASEGAQPRRDSGEPRTLHVVSGALEIATESGSVALARGQSAFLPAKVAGYRLRGKGEAVEVRVPIPDA